MPEWTTAQENAINARNSNILVSAAAGSGKTAVLVQRVIDIILDESLDAGIDKLLIVTFTNAAAAEMKSRISSALYEIIKEEPNNVRAINQLALLPSARISTIDSFCINLVRENFFRLDIAQDFKILDDSQKILVEQSAIDEVLESHYEKKEEDFKGLIDMLSSTKDDRALIEAVNSIYKYISAQAFPYEWLESVCESYNPGISLNDSDVKAYIFSELDASFEGFGDIIRACVDSMDTGDVMYDKYCGVLESDSEVFEALRARLSSSWEEVKSALYSIKLKSLPQKPKDYDGTAFSHISDARALYKDEIKSLKGLMTLTDEEFYEDNKKVYSKIKYLCKIVRDFNEKMLEIKKEMNAYTFSDIEHFAIELLYYKENDKLLKTDLAKEYESSFFEILVDEYQDTNSAQDTIFEMLSNGENRFMVGDIKQSIYRFRLAMPDIFNSKKNSFDEYNKSSDSINQKIILDKNFRSRKGICDFTNFTFSNLMSKRIGALEYLEEDYLNSGAEFEDTPVACAQLEIVETPEGEDCVEYEARQIAKLIISKIEAGEKIKDKKVYRNVCFGDFAVLLRYTKNRMNTYAKVFREYSIPVAANNKSSLFDNNEISVLISLLRVIDNPSRDIPLLATLMSVFYGYTADDIAKIRTDCKNESLYASVCKNRDTFGSFIDDIDRYKKYASSMSVENFLRQLLSSTSYLSLISAMGNAEQRRLNVLEFLNLARNFDNGESVGITAFMRYIDSIISSGANINGASVVNGRENCVTIMSVHQSKGLEFPICIYANTVHRYNDDDVKKDILMDYKEGIGFKVFDEQNLARYKSLQYECLSRAIKNSMISEDLRLLYVAITRAKEQFISFVSLDNPSKKISSLSKRIVGSYIPPVSIIKCQNDAQLLLLTALIHNNADVLRKLCDGVVDYDSNSDFEFNIEFASSAAEPEIQSENAAQSNQNTVEAIREKLSFEYERKALSGFSSKRSASELDERDRGYMFFAKSKPAFLSKSELSPAQKGSAMHTFMQYCDYNNAKADIESEIGRLVDEAYLSELQADSLNREKLDNFFNSALAKRMFESDNIYREIKVASFIKASELEDTDFDDEILVQGIADCVFEENGELVLVDYKTDYVKSEEELLNLYKRQISFYAMAVSKALEKPVKESLLYSFALDKPCYY